MGEIFKGLVDLVFPPTCHVCDSFSEQPLCADCFSSFPLIDPPLCRKCGKSCHLVVDECRECRGRRYYFSIARSAGLYEGNLKEAIHSLKYRNGRRLAPIFARLMVEGMEEGLDIDLVTFVPLSSSKERRRGYNQARLLALEISDLIDKPCIPALIQIKETMDQSKLSPRERRENVRKAFLGVAGVDIRGRSLLLIDDVFTTGATVNECSKALLASGAEDVHVLTLARSL
ncbi:MAG TPA: ComF family protein [Actinobacteria bacterium]|nr:ComF family protein [Actinomycetota bacterium]